MPTFDFSKKSAEPEAEPEISNGGGSVMGDGDAAPGLMHPHASMGALPAVLDATKRPPTTVVCDDCGTANDVTEDSHVCTHCCAPLPVHALRG